VIGNAIIDHHRPACTTANCGTGSLLGWLIVLLLITLAAHADNGGFRYEHWTDTNGSHGQTRRQGSTTDWSAYGPRGEQKHCHRYYDGDQPYSNCH
jgi:hypothetical protein